MIGSSARRWLPAAVVLVLLGAALAVVAVPAGAQPTPVISISPTSAAGGSSGTWSIVVSGQNWRADRSLSIQFANDPQTFFTPAETSWSTTITPARRIAGSYVIRVIQNCSDFDTCPVERTATFTSTVSIALEPPCSAPGTSQSLVVRGAAWNPQFQVTVTYDHPSANAQTFVPSANGDFARTFVVTPPDRDVVVFAEQPRLQQSARLVWSPCPPGPTTTSTSTTTASPTPVVVDTTTTTRPGDDPVPDDETTITTAPAPDTPGTPVTIPPTVDLPPPTPGATLTVAPELGPAGFVTGATGSGFPPGPVTVTWQPGIGATTSIAGPDGTFTVRMLVFPNDRLGPRAIIATAGATTAYDAFLVVQSSVQPSGNNVRHINRIRRFNQR